jgi:microcompartment protein CcmL/EutN
MAGPALALVELSSVARGLSTVDALVKKAPVRIDQAHPISPGHFLIVFTGDVAEVEESFTEALAAAGDRLIDQVFLPQVHGEVATAVAGAIVGRDLTDLSVAIVETFTVASAISASDAACKAAEVQVIQMRLGQGLGGKAYFVLAGELYDIEAAVSAATGAIPSSHVQDTEIIPRPHADFLALYRG